MFFVDDHTLTMVSLPHSRVFAASAAIAAPTSSPLASSSAIAARKLSNRGSQ